MVVLHSPTHVRVFTLAHAVSLGTLGSSSSQHAGTCRATRLLAARIKAEPMICMSSHPAGTACNGAGVFINLLFNDESKAV